MDPVGKMRNQTIKIRVTDEEAMAWREAATTAGHVSLSAWLRGLAMLSASTGIDATACRSTLSALRADLTRGIGNNLNQICRVMNAGRLPALTTIDQAIADVQHMRGTLTDLLATMTPRRASS